MPPSLPAVAAASPPRRWLPTLARAAFGLVFGAWSLLLIAWLTLHWGILPNAAQWRPQIERHASRALGLPVSIGRIEVRSSGWVPSFELAEVVLHDPQGREALRLPRVVAAVSARSLLAFELRFEQLLVDSARLDVRRDTAGRLHVAGLPLDAAGGDAGGGMADWFFEQHEFVIRGGTLQWTDELRGAPPLALTAVDLVVRNGLRRHAVRLDATPPPDWGERFSLRGRFTQSLLARAGDWRRWSGTAHVSLPRADVRELRAHVDLPFELSGGEGAARAWLDVRDGEVRGATADVALRGVAVRLAPGLQPLAFDRVEGRLAARRDDRGLAFAAERFGFVTAEGAVWPVGAMTLDLRQDKDAARTVVGGEFSAERLDLGLMAALAARIPLGEAVRGLLAQTAPQGVVQGLALRWDGPPDAPVRYQARGRAGGLALASAPSAEPDGIGRPGWRGADVEFTANERGGEARLVLDGGALEFPGVFERPLVELERFGARLVWRIERTRRATLPQLELKVLDARFANADAQGTLQATWRSGAGAGTGAGGRFPGVLDLQGRLDQGRAVATARYLPLGIPEDVRRWVERAVQDGRIEGADFRVKGDLWDFPYSQASQGEFRIAGRVRDVTLAYVPSEPGWASPWPAFTRVDGELVFDRTSMEIRNATARLWGVELARVNGAIRDLERATLAIDGVARGPAGELLRFVNATPVGEWTDQALRAATASGRAELTLALALPLDDLERSTVKGRVVLGGNDVRLRPDTPPLGNARARIDFTRQGFSIAQGAARVLGGDATVEGGSQADGSLRFVAQGTASAEGLRRADLGALSGLAASMTGQAPYRLQLGFVRGRPEFTLTSSLVGLGLGLPAPLDKAAEAALPLRVALAGEAPGRDQWRLDLGTRVQAQFVRDVSGAEPVVLRGGIAVDDALPTPAAGVHANVHLPRVDADAWEAVLDRLGGTAAAEGGGYLPQRVALRADELMTGARRLSRVVAGVTRVGGAWHANLDADQLNGYVEWHPARGAEPGRVHARLARLSLPPQQAQGVESLLEQAPVSAPALDIVVDDFELRGMKLGRVEIEAASRAGADWRLNRFVMATPDARLTATGQWSGAAAAASRRMGVEFKLDLADSGAFLERMGFGRTLKAGKGRLAGELAWSGSPLSLHVPTLDGRMHLALERGQFLKAGPGAARLLSVLSLQSLPRRLALDFRDVFQEGFVFDRVDGDITIDDGVASTNNLRLRGVNAAVLMEGRADLERETQDLRVIVVPEIDAGTAALAYAVINPAVGLTTFAAQLLLRRPLMAAGTREFHVGGSWDDPKVERVERPLGAPLPELDARPAAAASAPLNR